MRGHTQILWDAIGVSLRLTLAGVFIYACIHKIAHPYDFGLQVATYQILPLSLINLWAIVLPWLELIVGILLIVGLFTRASALVTIGMNVMFIVAIALALAAELQLQCGCFASAAAGDEMDMSLIVRDGFFVIMGAVIVFMTPDRLTLDSWLERRRQNA